MTRYKQGEVVLVEFGFSEGRGLKKRPALVISTEAYHQRRQEVIVAAITSNVTRELFGETKLSQWQAAGLLYPSVVTGVVRTIKATVVIRKLGTLPSQDFHLAHKNLGTTMGFVG